MDRIEKLNQRFSKDYNLPINIFSEDIFSYYMGLYDFFPYETYHQLREKIDKSYDGNVEKWLDYCADVRDFAIESVRSSEAWQEFNYFKDMSNYNVDPTTGERSCYTETTNGKQFISIDLKKANFQALKYIGVLTDDSYEDFIEKAGGDDYIKGSKYLRQVIFGMLNPSRQVRVEKYLIQVIHNFLKPLINSLCLTIYSMNSDEIVYEVHGFNLITKEILSSIEDKVYKQYGLNVRVEYISINKLPIINSRGNNIDAYVRKNLFTGEETLKKASTTFYPQIYKLWKGKEIEEKDKLFFFEDQLATFNEPLKFKTNGD